MNSINAKTNRWRRQRYIDFRDAGMPEDLAYHISKGEAAARRKLAAIVGFGAATDEDRIQLLVIERDDGTLSFNLTGKLNQLKPEQLDRMCKGKRVEVPSLSLIFAPTPKQNRRR
jgi:hypothetical protein